MLEEALDTVGETLGLGDIISDAVEAVLEATIFRVLYYAEIALCKLLGLLEEMFEVFAGITKVTYNGERDYLVNVFFSHRSISNVYWGMALIGIAMAFGFAIAAVARKLFDSGGKMQTSMGQIITAFVRSAILILGMSAVMVIVLNSTNVLMKQVNYLFNDPENLDLEANIVYTDEEYAAMARALKTIGNYSLNPSYSSRYNINTCFNEIRQDLYYLQQQKVFRYYYTTKDADGNEINTWQSVLQKVANSHDLRSDLKLDVSYDTVTKSLLAAMDTIRNDKSFKPLESYTRVVPEEGRLPLDRYVFLMGTMKAAKNETYNENPSLTDPVRGPYYSGEKSIYDIDQVDADFHIGFPTDYIVVAVAGIALIVDHAAIILNCIARIFNMLFLYIIAPPIFATQPLDGGGKTKQWLTAFIVQAFSAFGTIIAMRLLIILLPIVSSSDLVLFNSGLLDIMAKLVLVYGLFEVAKKATGLLTGILADSAGWQSIQAGDMSASAGKMVGGVAGAAKSVAGKAISTGLKATGKIADVGTKPLQNLGKRAWDATGGAVANAWNNLGKGDVEGQKAMASAKERLATEQAYAQLTGSGSEGGGGSGGSGGSGSLPSGSGPSGPGGSGGSGGSGGGVPQKQPPSLPSNQAGKPGGGGEKPLSPQAQKLFGTDANGKPKPKSLADELAAKAAAHPRPMTDAQGNIVKKSSIPKPPPPPPVPGSAKNLGSVEDFLGGSSHTGYGGEATTGGSVELGGAGSRPTLGGEQPEAPQPKAKEAPTIPNRRMTLDD